MVVKVLMAVVATLQAWEMMYKEMVQTVFLYVRDSGAVTDVILKVLEGFHHIVARRITGETAWQVREMVVVIGEGGVG